MIQTLYLFADTNLFIQCRPLNELDWQTWAAFDSIEVVIARPVQAELDRQKSGQGRVAKRARMANSLLRKLLDQDAIEVRASAPAVRLVLRPHLRPYEKLSTALDYSERDDQLVGIVAAFAHANPDATVQLLTHDTGPMASAKHVGLDYFPIPDAWLLPAESDAEEKRISVLQAELDRYQKAEPRFELRSITLPWKFDIDRYPPLEESQIAQLMTSLVQAAPKATNFGSTEPAERGSGLGLAGQFKREIFTPATDEEITTYQEHAYPEWLTKCATYLRELHLALNQRNAIPRIAMAVANIGSRPAEHAYISFEAKGDLKLLPPPKVDQALTQNDSIVGLPPPPPPPVGHWRRRAGLTDFIGQARLVGFQDHLGADRIRPLFMPHARDPNGFYWKPERPTYPATKIGLTCEQWRHHIDEEIFEFELHWQPGPSLVQGAIAVNIHAANLTKPFSIVEKASLVIRDGDTFQEAQALVAMAIGKTVTVLK